MYQEGKITMKILKESISTPITLGQLLEVVFRGMSCDIHIYTEKDRDIVCHNADEAYDIYRGRYPNANELLNSKVLWINVVNDSDFDNHVGLVIVIDYRVE